MACGPGKWGDKLVPDSPLGVELGNACEGHDECYGAPGDRNRYDCDTLFYFAMLSVCQEHAPGKRRRGYRMARRYYHGVRWFGWPAWLRCRWRERKK
jgi:hypothetical protein